MFGLKPPHRIVGVLGAMLLTVWPIDVVSNRTAGKSTPEQGLSLVQQEFADVQTSITEGELSKLSSNDIPADAMRYPRVSAQEAREFLQEGSLTRRTIPADLLVKALQCPPGYQCQGINLVACFIEGDVEASWRKTERSINIEYSHFDGSLKIDEGVFLKEVSIRNTIFSDQLYAERTIFNERSCFEYDRFRESGFFHLTRFDGGVDFTGSEFQLENNEMIGGAAIFAGAKFSDEAIFTDAKFLGKAFFDDAEFDTDVLFDRAECHDNVSFARTIFKGIVSLREAQIADEVAFKEATFPSLASFDGVREFAGVENKKNESELNFYGVTFRGPVSFNGVAVNSVAFPTNLPGTVTAKALYSPAVFERSVNFRHAQSRTVNFRAAEFRDYADFTFSKFGHDVWFTNVTFRDAVNFYRTEFPRGQGLHLQNVRFLKPTQLGWDQISDGQLADEDEPTLDTLEQAFKAGGDLESQNEALYRKKSLTQRGLTGKFLRYFWGFGVRPSFVFGWMLFLHILFTLAYWTQTKPLARRGGGEFSPLSFAWAFSWKTAAKWDYGFQNSRTALFKFLTLAHTFAIKVLLIFFLLALSNTSPLFHSIVGKLLPV